MYIVAVPNDSAEQSIDPIGMATEPSLGQRTQGALRRRNLPAYSRISPPRATGAQRVLARTALVESIARRLWTELISPQIEGLAILP